MDKQLLYDKKCEIIKSLLNTKYKKEIFVFEKYNNVIGIYNEIKFFTRIIINNKATITILPDNKWKEIEHNINIKLNDSYGGYKIKNCTICTNDTSKYTACNKCGNNWCIICYIELFKAGSGIIKCPFCRYTIGVHTPDYMMDICIEEIKIKAGLE
jgi:ArsR family metal-binding transcriptional regulator